MLSWCNIHIWAVKRKSVNIVDRNASNLLVPGHWYKPFSQKTYTGTHRRQPLTIIFATGQFIKQYLTRFNPMLTHILLCIPHFSTPCRLHGKNVLCSNTVKSSKGSHVLSTLSSFPILKGPKKVLGWLQQSKKVHPAGLLVGKSSPDEKQCWSFL